MSRLPSRDEKRPTASARLSSFSSIDEALHSDNSTPPLLPSPPLSTFGAHQPQHALPGEYVREKTKLAPSQVARWKQGEKERRLSCATCSSGGSASDNCTECSTHPLLPTVSVASISSHAAPLDFHEIVSSSSRDSNPSLDDVKRYDAHRSALESEKQHFSTYCELKAWVKSSQRSTKEKISSALSFGDGASSHRSHLPDDRRLLGLAKHCYPPRCDAEAFVYDMGDGFTRLNKVSVGQIEQYWRSKPEDVDLRWIHVPFNVGVAHTSVEDLFRYAGPRGRSFEHAGNAGFPFLETDSLHFRSRRNFEQMRTVHDLLSKRAKYEPRFLEDLNKSSFEHDTNEDYLYDVDWRIKHVGASGDFWSLSHSDMPLQLSEHPWTPNRRFTSDPDVMTGPIRGLQSIGRDYQKQAISAHPFFKDAQLVNTAFRTFHSADGFLLTLSSAKGVDYLDKNFDSYLQIPQSSLFEYGDVTCIGRIIQAFRESGTRTWHRKTVEWFLVYLITEIGSTPHNLIGGCNAPDLRNAYESVVADLKRRRYDGWEARKGIDLVREYLTCIDELNILSSHYKNKISLFDGLMKDCEQMELEFKNDGIRPNNPDADSITSKARWALKSATERYDHFQILIRDLTQSLEALFQMRSIEQNERQILSEKLNKAVFVFTGVTIIFLPLSFFTSYFSMNIPGIITGETTQRYFWALCGTCSFVIVLSTMLYAIRVRVPGLWSWRRRQQKAFSHMV